MSSGVPVNVIERTVGVTAYRRYEAFTLSASGCGR
jgi:hypothetical protein